MSKLVYPSLASLDGYVADVDGDFAWAAPDREVHAFVNDLERQVGTHLCGRRLYEVMSAWDAVPTEPDPRDPDGDVMADFASVWQAADKVVYSETLASVDAPRTRIARRFDADEVRRMLRDATREVSVGGPQLASEALRVGLVDEIRLLLSPVVVGGGTAALPDGVWLDLELLEERRFTAGTVFLRYRVARPGA
jgi:dihydrofolate reductase